MENIMNNENAVWTQIINKKDEKPRTEDETQM